MAESIKGEVKLKRPLLVLKTAAAADAANDLYLIWRTIAQSRELVPPVIYLAVLELGDILYNIFLHGNVTLKEFKLLSPWMVMRIPCKIHLHLFSKTTNV